VNDQNGLQEMNNSEEIWWIVKVYDEESQTTTNLVKFGTLEEIKKELNEDGLWTFVSAKPEE
jgi:hypothetical protein